MQHKTFACTALALTLACAPDPSDEYKITTTIRPPIPAPQEEIIVDAGLSEDARPDVEPPEPAVTGSGGEGGNPGGTGGASMPPALVAAEDAPAAPEDGDADAGVTPDADARDLRPPSDAARVDGIYVAKSCGQVACPALFDLARRCNGHDSSCRFETRGSAGAVGSSTIYCHANGVVKRATVLAPVDNAYRARLSVTSPDGKPCYALEMTTEAGAELERWLFRSWTGDIVARGAWDGRTGKTYLTCDDVTYDVSATNCPGTDGEPGPGECVRGACP